MGWASSGSGGVLVVVVLVVEAVVVDVGGRMRDIVGKTVVNMLHCSDCFLKNCRAVSILY